MSGIDELFGFLVAHERKLKSSFSLIPSENMLSPMARLAFLSDGFSRYFFDEQETFGRWSFQGGSIIGEIQKSILFPLFQRVGKAKYVDVHPLSGLNGMMLVLAAFGGAPGDHIFSVPTSMGGHPDTQFLARKLGLRGHDLPAFNWFTIDLDALAAMVKEYQPSLVYFDQATTLFPLDLSEVIQLIRAAAARPVHIHVDSSHVNGLIWGGHLPNPLTCGADTYGGSTHKTFPGPHKAVIFTNEAYLSEQLMLTAANMISHHHMSDVIALAITLLEFVECGGETYVSQMVKNARAFAECLSECGFDVQGKGNNFTNNHQVWIDSAKYLSPYDASGLLFEAGLIVNPYNPIPSLGAPGIRMGVNEATRLGLKEPHMLFLAECFRDVLIEGRGAREVGAKVAALRAGCKPEYCYDEESFRARLAQLCSPFDTRGRDESASLMNLLFG